MADQTTALPWLALQTLLRFSAKVFARPLTGASTSSTLRRLMRPGSRLALDRMDRQRMRITGELLLWTERSSSRSAVRRSLTWCDCVDHGRRLWGNH